jgi:Uncharacterized membrane protein
MSKIKVFIATATLDERCDGMGGEVFLQLSYILRLLVAAICGSVIGYERNSRMKEAGIRTHFIVAIGAALIMLVSKYGFQDILLPSKIVLDPSRTAAQVVSGVGFLGAGIIFMHRQTIRGLTTAAGIWATAGIGLAVGAGFYTVGIAATVIILAGQILLHGRIKWLSSPITELITLQIANQPGVIQKVREILEKENVVILNFKAKENKDSEELTDVKIAIRVLESYDITNLLCILQDDPNVRSVEF